MSKVYVSGLSSEGEYLLNSYLNAFVPDAIIEPLSPNGVKGKIKMNGKKPDILLIIVDETIYQTCMSVAEDIMTLPKVHKYVDDDGLLQFLISKFGKLEGVSNNTGVIPPDVLLQQANNAVDSGEDLNLSSVSEELSESDAKDAQIAELQEKLARSEALCESLSKREVAEQDNSEITKKITVLVDTIKKLKTEIEEKDKELELSNSSSAETISKLAKAERSIKEVETLRSELKSIKESSSVLEFEKSKVEGELETANKQIQTLNNRIIELEDDNSRMQGDISEYTTLSDNLKQLGEDIDSRNNEIRELKNERNELNAQLSTIKSERDKALSELSASKADSAEIKRKELELENKESEIRDLQSQLTELSAQLDTIQADKKMNDSLVESTNLELKSSLDTLTQKEGEITELNGNIDTLKREKYDLSQKIEQLESQLRGSTSDIESRDSTIEDLKSQITDLKTDIDNLRETTVQKSIYDSLKLELDSAKNTAAETVSSEEVEELKAALKEERITNANYQIEMSDMEDYVNELQNSIFTQLSDVALPKVNYDIKAHLTGATKKFVCIAGGSLESQSQLYQIIRRSCLADPNKRVLIVDLVTDSRIDLDFTVKSINSPINWLNGAEPFKDFVASTRYPNIKVISTGLAYINDLYFLNVDWDARFKEICNFGDVIVVNVGCLNNTISRVLFNTFSKYMKSYVLTKATPINLRTVLLNMLTFKEVSTNVVIECFGFDKKTSADMYQRLVQRFKANILKDTDVLSF